jgi:hypothetical protein
MGRARLFLIPRRDCSSMMLVHAELSRDLECAACRAPFDPVSSCFDRGMDAGEAPSEASRRTPVGPGSRT